MRHEIMCIVGINPFQPSLAFHTETSHLFCSADQMTGFYMECNTGLKWIKGICKLFAIRQKCESQNGCSRKTPIFPKNEHFLPPDTHAHVCVSGVNKR